MKRQVRNISLADNHDARKGLLQVVQRSLERLSDQTGPAVFTFRASRGGGKTTFLNTIHDVLSSVEDVTLLGPWDAGHVPPDQLASEVLAAVEAAAGGNKKVVLLDNLDALLRGDNEAGFFDFERKVVHGLIERGDVLIITTGQAEIRQWREYDVRIRQENYRIPTLTSSEVQRLAIEWRLDPGQALALSLGHPQVLCWLREEPGLTEQEIDRKAAAYFLEGLSFESSGPAKIASLFPIFDVAVLRQVLPPKGNGEAGFYTDYLDRIRELMGAGLVFWDVEVGMYRHYDSTIRRLLARGLRHQQPADFDRIHRSAAEYYQLEARRATYLHHHLVSALYHLAQAHRSEGPAAVGERCLRWVQERSRSWIGADWNAVARAWQTGAGDVTVVDELKELIGSEVYVQITQLLKTANQTVEVLL